MFQEAFFHRLTVSAALGAAVLGSLVGYASMSVADEGDRLQGMISPVANPLIFEDPRILSELRPVYAHHEIQRGFVTQGGSVNYYALQARFAVDPRWAIIATKDGYIDFNPDSVLNDEEGWANITAGAKYAFYLDEAAGQIATAGLRYEIPLGTDDVFQGEGDGVLNPFVSAGFAIGPVNLLLNSGLRIPFDDQDSTFFDANVHVSYPIAERFFPAFEVNLVNVTDAGGRLGIADEGFDLFNFGSTESGGETTVLGAAALRIRITDDLDWGVAYQFPMSSGAGSNLTQWRLTTDFIWRFSLT